MSKKFVYVIFDNVTGEVWEVFLSEDECVSKYKSHYEGFLNIDWMAINIDFVLKHFFHVGE